MADVYLRATSLHKSFRDFKAVDGVSFTIDKGEIFGLLGPNGAGKTTTIRMLSTVLEPDEGEINYPAVFEAIDRLGYRGWVACEYKPRGRTEDGLAWARPYGVSPVR